MSEESAPDVWGVVSVNISGFWRSARACTRIFFRSGNTLGSPITFYGLSRGPKMHIFVAS